MSYLETIQNAFEPSDMFYIQNAIPRLFNQYLIQCQKDDWEIKWGIILMSVEGNKWEIAFPV